MVLMRAVRRAYRFYKRIQTRESAINPKKNAPQVDGRSTVDLRRRGFSLQDSFCYDLKYNDYHEYISTWESWQPRLCETPYFRISDDKYLFACVFGNLIEVPPTYALIESGRVIGVSAHELSAENLYDRLCERGGVIKDRFGYNGYNVYSFHGESGALYCKGNPVSREEFSGIVRGFSRGIVQGRLEQGSFENAIFDGSVNTIRVISVRGSEDGAHEVIGAVHRFGTCQSAPVDNFDQRGVCALIDIDTGRMGKLAGMYDVDASGRHVFHERHPDTGVQVEGVTIPEWNGLKARIAELTRRLPFFAYVAWDFVVQDGDFALIEINMKSSLYLFQIHRGMRNTLIGEKYRERGYLVERWG